MYQSFKYLRLIMLAVFAVVCAGLWGYQYFHVWPQRACEAEGHWWDSRDRICAIPMPLSTFTGRPMHAGSKPERMPAGN